MNKILNIFKPKGPTSHDMVEKIRRKYPGQKVGHAGSLDPIAEGVLIIGIGKATKKLAKLTKKDKQYQAEIAFGLKSETDDLESPKIKEAKIPALSKKQVKKTLTKFKGKINQKVPLYSATHYQGEKLYKRARGGEKIAYKKLPEKKVWIKKLELIDSNPRGFKLNKKKYPLIKLKITCSSGTYIRSLARDIGKDLKTFGILVGLIRTRVGDYRIKESIKLD